jgi:hypothetical protein
VHFGILPDYQNLSTFDFIKECSPFIFGSVFIFGCFEKYFKERFVVSFTNARSLKVMIAMLDKQPSSCIVIKENCDILFFNKAFADLTTNVSKPIPKNLLTLFEEGEEIKQVNQFKAFVTSNFDSFRSDTLNEIELRITKQLKQEDESFAKQQNMASESDLKNDEKGLMQESDFFLKYEIVRVTASPFFFKDSRAILVTIRSVSCEKAQLLLMR